MKKSSLRELRLLAPTALDGETWVHYVPAVALTAGSGIAGRWQSRPHSSWTWPAFRVTGARAPPLEIGDARTPPLPSRSHPRRAESAVQRRRPRRTPRASGDGNDRPPAVGFGGRREGRTIAACGCWSCRRWSSSCWYRWQSFSGDPSAARQGWTGMASTTFGASTATRTLAVPAWNRSFAISGEGGLIPGERTVERGAQHARQFRTRSDRHLTADPRPAIWVRGASSTSSVFGDTLRFDSREVVRAVECEVTYRWPGAVRPSSAS